VHKKRKKQVCTVRKQRTQKGHCGKLGAELDVGRHQGRGGAADWEESVKMVQIVENKS